jgi:beta-glucosidase-like glycosyl hydrolase
VIFGRNVESREQLRALTDDLRALHGRDRLLISIDQEGGPRGADEAAGMARLSRGRALRASV